MKRRELLALIGSAAALAPIRPFWGAVLRGRGHSVDVLRRR